MAGGLAGQQRLLVRRLRQLLRGVSSPLRKDIASALGAGGKLLSSGALVPAGVWPLLTLCVARQIAPDIDSQLIASIAIAVECYVSALDLLDDIEDEDRTAVLLALGEKRARIVAMALLSLSQRALLAVARRRKDRLLALTLCQRVNASALSTTAGQQRDLLAEVSPADSIALTDAIAIARLKAGSIMRLACELGALAAGADEDTCAGWGRFGEHMGVAHQIENDLAGLLDPAKTDVRRGKKTLPLVLMAHCEGLSHGQALEEAVLTCKFLSLLYRSRATDLLRQLTPSPTPELLALLSSSRS